MRRLLSFVLLTIPALAWPQARRFQNPVFLPTANDPGALTVGDWNHDNKPDLIYIDGTSIAALHVLLGNGDGTFTPGQTVALPSDACHYYVGRSCYLTSADINGDGKPDLIFAAIGNSLTGIITLLGNGDGTFGVPIISTIKVPPSNPEINLRPAVGDFNGDGKPDLVVADPLNGGAYFLSGDGGGHFAYGSTFSNSKYDTGRPTLAYAGDFNGDGKLDILMLSGGGTTSATVYYGNGNGSFTEGPGYSAGLNGIYAQFSMYGDVTGDGVADLVGTDQQSNVWILPGRSDGSFGTALQLAGQLDTRDSILGAADLNGDGLVDFIAQTAAGIRILPGAAGTTLGNAQIVTAGAANILGTVIGDFNGDGIQDVASATEGGIVLLFGNTAGSFTNSTIVNTGKTVVAAIAGDFNGDGKADALIQQSDGSFQTFFGGVSGSLSAGTPFTPGISLLYMGNTVGDFDGDGKLDVAFGHAGLQIQILYGDGDGSFTPGVASPGMGSGLVGDLNGDGKTDIVGVTGPTIDVASNYLYNLTSMLGSSGRTLTTVTTALPPFRQGLYTPLLTAIGDLNHDGHLDVVLYDRNQQAVNVWIGNGDGTFRAGSSVDTSALQLSIGGIATSYSIGGIADIDGDGNADLIALGSQLNAATNLVAPCIVVLYGDGSGGFGPPQILPISHSYTTLYLADVNQDGKIDVVLTDGVLISVLPNDGNRNLGSEQRYVGGSSISTLAVGDFNGDNYPDLLTTSSGGLGIFTTNVFTVLLNQADTRNLISGSISISPATVAYNQSFTLNASLLPSTSGGQLVTGTVNFSVDGVQVGVGQVQNGMATVMVPGTKTQTIAYGLHTVAGIYSGDGHYPSAWLSGALTVQKPDYPTSTSLTASPTATLASDYVTLTAVVTAPAAVTAGFVTFYDGSSIIGQSQVSSSGTAILQTNLLGIASHNLTADYQGFNPINSYVGNAIYEPSVSPAVVVTVTGIPTSTTVSGSTLTPTAGAVFTMTAKVIAPGTASIPNGGVTFFDNSNSLGTVSLDSQGSASFSTSSLAAGTHTLFAVYNQNGIFASSTAGNTPTTVTVSTSNLHASYVLFTGSDSERNSPSAIQTTVIGSQNGEPSGLVTLIEDGQIVGTALASASGVASFPLNHSDSSTHTFFASYAGSDEFAPSSSTAILSAVGPLSDFSLHWSSNEPILLADTGSHDETTGAQALLQVSAWNGTVSLSCPGSTSVGYSCDFAPNTLTGAGVSLLTVRPIVTANSTSSVLAAVALALVIPCFCYRRRLLSALVIISFGTLVGCRPSTNSVETYPHVLTIQATSGNIIHSIQVLVRTSSAKR